MEEKKICLYVYNNKAPTRAFYWRCLTCGFIRDEPVCDVCIKECHKGHRVKAIGFANLYCHCGESPYCISKPNYMARDTCSYKLTVDRPHPQHLFKCLSCNLKGICVNCINTCHANHVTSYFKFKKNAHCLCGKNTLEPPPVVKSVEINEQEHSSEDGLDPESEVSSEVEAVECKLINADYSAMHEHKQCSFGVFREKYLPQKVFECFTCGFHSGNLVCQACAEICHSSHLVKYKKDSPAAYCDCGKRGPGSCKCLKPLKDEEILKIRTELITTEYKSSKKKRGGEKDDTNTSETQSQESEDESMDKEDSESESSKKRVAVVKLDEESADANIKLFKEPCVVCLEEPKDAVIYPCGHTCLCMKCGIAMKIRSQNCPLCRCQIKEIIKLRIS